MSRGRLSEMQRTEMEKSDGRPGGEDGGLETHTIFLCLHKQK
jgi:hypothetical protein